MNEHSDIKVREATKKDIAAIRLLANDTWPVTYKDILSEGQLRYMMELIYGEESLNKQFDLGHHFLIAEEKQKQLAFASYNMLKPGVYKLQKVYVLPSEQGRGLGKLLINHIIESIKREGATSLLLNVNRYNTAKQVYEHLGFTVIGEEDIDIGEGYFMNDYVMEKKV